MDLRKYSLEPLYIYLFLIISCTLLAFVSPTIRWLKPISFIADIITREPTVNTSTTQLVSSANTNSHDTLGAIALPTVLTSGTLHEFNQALQQKDSSKQSVRIAYFGDSMIEGDLLTNDLRKLLQKMFGGSGVGMVPITAITAGFRANIRHQFNNNWTTYNFATAKAPKYWQYSPSGYVFNPQSDAWVNYKASNEYAPFRTIELYYGRTKAAKIKVAVDIDTVIYTLESDKAVNRLILADGKGAKGLSIQVEEADSASLFGLSFENGQGVYLDNYSFRGNSGIPLSVVSPAVYSGFARQRNYKLVILHYGLNVVGHDAKDYGWYKIAFGKTIEHIKTSFPDASILLISVSDKAYNNDGTWITEPDIPIFVQLQADLAKKHGIAFWNLYEAMGGYNTMKNWVDTIPALANADYTHVNHRGATKIAHLLYKYLIDEYMIDSKEMELVAKDKMVSAVNRSR